MQRKSNRITIEEYKRSQNSVRLRRAHIKSDEVKRSFIRQCQNAGLPVPATEYKFHPVRKWRVDFCWIELRIVFESEGGLFAAKSGHRTLDGIRRDMEKYNEAARLGFRVFRFTPEEFTDGTAVSYFSKIISG